MNIIKLKNFVPFLLVASALAVAALAADRKPVPIPASPKPMKYKNLRGVIYCEVWLFKGTPETGIAGVYYNTSDLNNSADKKNTCPVDMWAKIAVPELMSQYDVVAAYKNGPRGWTMDWIDLPVGPVVSFDGLQARWMGQGELPKGVTLKEAHMAPYKPLQSHRQSTMHFDKGKPVFIIDDAEGTPWVMQAFGQLVDPNLTYDGLKDIGSRLKLPAGWKYRVVTLDKDLTISTPQGYNWIVQDDLQNTYDACKEGACNYKP
jgi:hypothetical protein